MAKITSKYQVTVPKKVAEQYRMSPGDEIEWIPAGETIRVVPYAKVQPANDREFRLHLFDQATQRIRKRAVPTERKGSDQNRGWTREGLYNRGRSR